MRGLLVPRLPSGGSHYPYRRRSKRDRVGLRWAMVIIAIGIPANWFWSMTLVPIPILILLLIVLSPFEFPHVAFGSIAAIIFAFGCYLRLPPVMARLSPARRGLAVLALVIVFHGIWFQFGWVPFRPLCTSGGGPLSFNSERALVGPMTPEAAAWFVKTNEGWWGDGVARLSGSDRVLVRPAIALFDNEINWNFTSKVAGRIAEERGLPMLDHNASDRCREVELLLMAGGQAEQRATGWGTWPWSTFDEDGLVVRWLRDLHFHRREQV